MQQGDRDQIRTQIQRDFETFKAIQRGQRPEYQAVQSCTLRDVAPELAWTEGDQILFNAYCRRQEDTLP